MYKDPTPEDWAKLDRGDFDPPQLSPSRPGSPMDVDPW